MAGDPNQASPAAIEKHLKGIDFPSDKGGLMRHAQDHGAPDDVMRVLDRMPNREYHSAADVARGVGQAE